MLVDGGCLLPRAAVLVQQPDVPQRLDDLLVVTGPVDDGHPGLGERGDRLVVGLLSHLLVAGLLADVLGAEAALDGRQEVSHYLFVVLELRDEGGVGQGQGVLAGGGLGQVAGVGLDGGVDDLLRGAEPFGDGPCRDAEDGQLFDGGEPVGVGQGVAAFVLVPLLGDPFRLAVVVADDQDRDGGPSHLDCAEGAPLAALDGQGAVVGADDVDRVHDPELA